MGIPSNLPRTLVSPPFRTRTHKRRRKKRLTQHTSKLCNLLLTNTVSPIHFIHSTRYLSCGSTECFTALCERIDTHVNWRSSVPCVTQLSIKPALEQSGTNVRPAGTRAGSGEAGYSRLWSARLLTSRVSTSTFDLNTRWIYLYWFSTMGPRNAWTGLRIQLGTFTRKIAGYVNWWSLTPVVIDLPICPMPEFHGASASAEQSRYEGVGWLL